jgi:hypothetical protein
LRAGLGQRRPDRRDRDRTTEGGSETADTTEHDEGSEQAIERDLAEAADPDASEDRLFRAFIVFRRIRGFAPAQVEGDVGGVVCCTRYSQDGTVEDDSIPIEEGEDEGPSGDGGPLHVVDADDGPGAPTAASARSRSIACSEPSSCSVVSAVSLPPKSKEMSGVSIPIEEGEDEGPSGDGGPLHVVDADDGPGAPTALEPTLCA